MSTLVLTQRGRGRGRRNAGVRSPGDPTGPVTAVSQVYKGTTCNTEAPATSTVGFAAGQSRYACADPARVKTSCGGGGTAVRDCKQQNNTTGASWNSAALDSSHDSPRSMPASASLPSPRYPGQAVVEHPCKGGHRASESRRQDRPDTTRVSAICNEGGAALAVHDFKQPKNAIRASVGCSQGRAMPALNSPCGSVPSAHTAAPTSSAGPPGHVGDRSWKDKRQATHSQHQEGQRRAPLAEARNSPCNNTLSRSRKPASLPSAKSSAQPSRGKHPKAFSEAEPQHGRAAGPGRSAGTGQLYAFHLHENCPDLPPVTDIVKQLQAIQAEFQRDHLSMERPCSITDTDRCWIVDSLRTFNRILVRVDIELKEEEPQRLCICSLDKAVVAHSNSDWVFDACILFHLLLKRHRCIQTLNLDRTVIASGYPQLLYDALACNRSLRHLAITCWDFLPGMGRPLVYSLCRMPTLKSVSISRLVLAPEAAGRIGDMLGRAKSLQSVQLVDNELSSEAGGELVKGLSRNGNLKVIKLGNNALGPDGAHFLGGLLGKSSNLRELSLRNVPGFDEQQALSVVDGLKQNSSLHKLELHGCHVHARAVDALAEVLAKGTLQCLVLSACSLAQAQSVSVMLEVNKSLLELDLRGNLINDMGAMRLAQALRCNRNLLKLNLEGNHRINTQGVVALIDALKHNTVLKELNLGCFEPEDPEDDEDVASALDRAVAYDRVRLCYDTRGVLQLSANLRVNAERITSVHLDSSVELDATCLKDLFVALATAPCLEDLCIESPATMDGTAARRLARVLNYTTTLRLLQISACNMDSIALMTVMAAMEKNESVTQLDMDYSTSDATCTQAFVAMIKKNRTLTHFGCMSTKLSELQAIAHELRANYTLTTFKIWEKVDFEETVFEINEILRRNASYLNRTVEYALYPKRFGGERGPALAFLDACQLQPFKKHLAKLAGSEAAARKAMQNAREHIQFYLFAITGVCKQVPVRCWPNPTGATQMDCLNDPCWRSIFSYLDVTDIRPE